jgi:ABC-type polysaccharide/polyol phosphate transport system ATPase subunit
MNGLLSFDRVSKRFRRGSSHDSLRDLIPSLFGARNDADEFWALRDISFQVVPGEVLGIIGHNGAGKSTILKLLNRIIEPTAGTIVTRGRVGSLIEVSAGFHQDLSGRQNVYLQGAIMGMSRREIQRKFDDIVEFAGLEQFIDTPVKRYSSGMNARLGFSIAAHLEPDVLIIDEVLAVGDHTFQSRAFGRLKEMAASGAPVVLVSHQMDKVAEICTSAMLLERGVMRAYGTPGECIREYLYARGASQQAPADGAFALTGASVSPADTVTSGENLTFTFSGTGGTLPSARTSVMLRVVSVETGGHAYATIHDNFDITLPLSGRFELQVSLEMNLADGGYLVGLSLWDSDTNIDVVHGPQVEVHVASPKRFWGAANLRSKWSLNAESTICP